MSEIKRTGKWNPGGGRWLEVICTDDVSTFARTANAVVITLKPGASWTRIYTTPGTLQYREEPQSTDNGRLYSYEIKGFSPDDNAQKGSQIDALFAAERMLVRFTDNTGLLRLAGSLVEWMGFEFAFATDPDVAGQRGYTITLKGNTTTRAAYV